MTSEAMKTTLDCCNANAGDLFPGDGGFRLIQEETQDGATLAREIEKANQSKEAADAAQLRLAVPEPPSVPPGWRTETYQGYGRKTFTRAIDPDGCKWYDVDGEWKLSVPWFRRSIGLPRDKDDDLAVVETVTGDREYPITEAGVVLIGKRRIGPRQWDH